MKKNIAILLCMVLLSCFIFSGCDTKDSTVSKSGFYFDTIITICLYGTSKEEPIDKCFELAEKYENLLSNTIETSDVSKINNNIGSYVTVSPETLELIKLGINYGELSEGKFDITIGKLSELWNISDISANLTTKDNQTDESVLPDPNQIEFLAKHVDYHNVHIKDDQVMLSDSDSKIDLGGIAKGYIADQMKQCLQESGVKYGYINLGGNVLTIGAKPDGSKYKIGIQKPFSETGESIAAIEISDQSVVSSGVYERYYRVDNKLYHHILNPLDGYPIENNLYGVTIISDKSVDGDGLSTTCFSLGLEKGMELIESLDNVEAVFITNDYHLHGSSGIGDTIPLTLLQ